jgi:hypothetical protein
MCSAFSDDNDDTKKPYHNDTAQCDSLMDLSAWTVKDFLQHYTGTSFDTLLSQDQQKGNGSYYAPPSLRQMQMHMMGERQLPVYMQESSAILQRPDEDSLLWDGPISPAWVACNQKNKTCYGKIPKSKWYDQSKRGGTCVAAFLDQVFFFHCVPSSTRYFFSTVCLVDAFSMHTLTDVLQVQEGNVQSSAVGIDICNLNRKTDELCKIIQAARRKVFEANCIFAGVCVPQVFVYAPGMYSASNQDFVRGTVSSFYEMFKQVW